MIIWLQKDVEQILGKDMDHALDDGNYLPLKKVVM